MGASTGSSDRRHPAWCGHSQGYNAHCCQVICSYWSKFFKAAQNMAGLITSRISPSVFTSDEEAEDTL